MSRIVIINKNNGNIVLYNNLFTLGTIFETWDQIPEEVIDKHQNINGVEILEDINGFIHFFLDPRDGESLANDIADFNLAQEMAL